MDEIDDIMNEDAGPETAGDSPTGGDEAPATAAAGQAQSVGIELDDLAADPAPSEVPPEADADGDSGREARAASELSAVFDVPVQISAVLGHTEIEVSDMLQLDTGAIIKLDRKIGEAIDIYVNDRLVARGEVVIVENRLGITMTEIFKQETA